ncbi:MAG: amidohydrolase [Planctomycetaceae bacterium]|nr:MAG: amidohydrolase [Planctomycetaceae bacterium]
MTRTACSSQPVSRRFFLKNSIAAAGIPVCLASADADITPDHVPRIDCHLHCFAGDQDDRFPYHPLSPYRPLETATPEHLLACMDGAEVAKAIVVHPEPYQDDHRYLEHCLRLGEDRLRGTALFFAGTPRVAERLTELASRVKLVAARIHAYAPERLPQFESMAMRELWRTASELGLAVQLHLEPRYAPRLEPLIREFHTTQVIIDHLGRPFQGTPEEHSRVIRWADLPNTWIKLSSIPEQAQYPHRDIRPVIGKLVQAFGAERMLYGGGFNHRTTATSYRAAFDRGASLLDGLSTSQQAMVLGGNADRLFFT